ncbi:MAG TPA: BON domain-containing protein [Candidatus Dormibacteraeota bacterium]|jgi:osmotically-inducible protein OsmY
MSRSDAELKELIERALEAEPGVDASAIAVAVTDGIVILGGEVPTYSARWMAVRTAERVVGTRAVVDEIQVRLVDDHIRSDADIARAAAFALEWDTEVPDGVTATVENRIITLHGEVDTPHQREAAERAVRNLMGVRGVVNVIRVRAPVA